MKTQTDKPAVMDSRTVAGGVTIGFVSPSGETLGHRFAVIRNYYARIARQSDNTPQWIAEQVKRSLIRNIENGCIVVAVNGKNEGIA